MTSKTSWASLVSKTPPPQSVKEQPKTFNSHHSKSATTVPTAVPVSKVTASSQLFPTTRGGANSRNTSTSHSSRRSQSPPQLQQQYSSSQAQQSLGRPRSRTDSFLGEVVTQKALASRRRLASLSPRGLVPCTAPTIPAIGNLDSNSQVEVNRQSPAELSATQIRRTLSAHGKSLFVGSYALPTEQASVQQENKPESNMPGTSATPVEDEWSTVPTKKERSRARKERQEQRRALGIYEDTSSVTRSDDEDHDSIADLSYDALSSNGRRQQGAAKKTNQFKAAQKRAYSQAKRNAQRDR